MSETTITQLPDPSGFSSDPFTDVLRDGARKLIEQAIHAELATLMNAFSKEKLEDGRARLVRHGHLPEREVMTGIGPVPVKVPRVRDRGVGEDKITFTPSILPRYLRRAKSVEELLPWLYLKGVSTGDFTEALEALLGPNAKGLSAFISTIRWRRSKRASPRSTPIMAASKPGPSPFRPTSAGCRSAINGPA
jgi:transposase-like protein